MIMSKIFIVDEVVRLVWSLGDVIKGDFVVVWGRWKNWKNDSFFVIGGKMVGLMVVLGVLVMVGKIDIVVKLIKKVGKNGEKFGVIVISSVL